MLDVRRLRVLREVARRGSLAGAADALSYTPSAVSQQIAALERETATVLLERRARGVVLTEAGHLLVAHAESVLADLAAAELALSELAELRRGRLRLASFATAGAAVLPRAIDVFRARHPGIDVTVRHSSPSESVASLRAGSLDLALTVDLEAHPAEGVEVIPLFDDPLKLALHRDHPAAFSDAFELAALRDETWIEVPLASRDDRLLERVCAQAGFVPRIELESDDYTAIQELVGAGLGVALVPDLAFSPPHDAVVLRSLGPDGPRRRIQAATRTAPFRSPAADAMVGVLRELEPRRRPESARRGDAVVEPVARLQAGIP